ncbi:MAG TPA: ABC transporter permease, partial [Candidatus Deferrimicrobium sp.]|nr:ABC transporter permease [Candidatus Deferrimicrobium sp.]
MIVVSLVRMAFQALIANKLRSGLTLLGVIIGVTSVMTIISALEGMMDAIASDLERLGPATFIATTLGGVVTSDEQWHEMLKRKALDLEAVRDIEAGCNLCDKVSPRTNSWARVKYGNKSLRGVRVAGSTSSLIEIVDIEVAQGRFHSAEDDAHRRQVVFIGDFIRETFFEGIDPLNKELNVSGKKYTVIGVGKKQGAIFGENRDNYIMIPLSTHLKQFGQPRKNLAFFIKALSVEQLKEAIDQVRVILRSRRHVPFDKPDDFSILTADELLSALNNVTRIFRLGLVGISSISLVVGGIVVMN